MSNALIESMTREQRNALAHEICKTIAMKLDAEGIYKSFHVALPYTDVVFIRGFGTSHEASAEETVVRPHA